MKYTANAPRVAAAAIMLNPYVRGAATIAGWLGLAGLVYDEASGLWTSSDSERLPPGVHLSTGYEFQSGTAEWHPTQVAACQARLSILKPTGNVASFAYSHVANNLCYVSTFDKDGKLLGTQTSFISGRRSDCPSGWYVTPAGCVQNRPATTVTPDEAVEELTKHPMPAEVPKHIPVPLPVEMPYFEPLFIPTGNPVANPKYDPSKPLSPENQPYVQPGTKVSPAPAPGAPWQVDTVPVNRPTPTPEGSTEPSTEPSTDTPREDGKEDRDFCDKNPNVLACLELDTPEGEIPKGTFNVTYAVENSWGNGSCPADKYATLAGKSVKVYDWAQTCDYVATYVRPILLLLCALGALFIVMPGRAEI